MPRDDEGTVKWVAALEEAGGPSMLAVSDAGRAPDLTRFAHAVIAYRLGLEIGGKKIDPGGLNKMADDISAQASKNGLELNAEHLQAIVRSLNATIDEQVSKTKVSGRRR